jgi:hypothetical protein
MTDRAVPGSAEARGTAAPPTTPRRSPPRVVARRRRPTTPIQGTERRVAPIRQDPVDPTEPPPLVPTGARRQVARYLGATVGAQEQLRDALILVAERHERGAELAQGATTLALWSARDLRALGPIVARYGSISDEHPQQLRSAVLTGTRIGATGELDDVRDLAALVQFAQMTWTVLVQGARSLRDGALLEVATTGREHSRRQLAWLRTFLEHHAADALAVSPSLRGQVAMSIPKRPNAVASIPDPIWAPTAGGLLIGAVGAIAVLAGLPALLPSLGPSAVLVGLQPNHPSARPWNTLVGHALGLLAGFAAVLATGATGAPTVLGDQQLVPVRVVASAIAIALTILLCQLARASHPPAAATTLLVTLGSIATLKQSMTLMVGVILLAVIGEGLRHVRRKRRVPAERMAPPRGLVRTRLRGH